MSDEIVCGIDEAGRGPVIGPLVMAGVSVDSGSEKILKEIGVKDSKLLIHGKREELFDKIIDTVLGHKIIIVPAEEIDAALKSSHLNLNWLEANISAEIIDSLKPDTAIVDAPGNNITAYGDYLRDKIKCGAKLVVEHKADLNHIPVGAASILAKVVRDREIEKLKKKIGVDFGSGYPSDERTQKFLKENFEKYDNLFRKSWAPYKELFANKYQRKVSDF